MTSPPLRVLLLEDDPDDAALLRQALRGQVLRRQEDAGYDVTWVEDEPGFRAALESSWDVVVVDYRLPSFSAPAALGLLQELGLDTPVVVISGQIGDESAAEVVRLGAADFLSKDRLALLPQVLQRCLAEAKERRRRRSAERALADQAALLDLQDDAIIVWDPDQVVTYWNRGAQRIYGFTRTEASREVVHELLGTEFPVPLAEILTVLEDCGSWKGELVQRCHDERRIVVASRWTAKVDDRGRPAGIIQVDRDETIRRAAEDELARRAEQLEHLNAELAHSNAELEQFAYVASHDLAAPIRAIAGPLELLQRRYAGRLDADAEEFIGFAVDACERMDQLIAGLLAVSRVGRGETDLEPTDCNQVVSRVLAVLGPAIEQTRAQVTVGDLPTVQAHRGELSQAFQNLIGNALKFVAPGVRPAVTITAEQAGEPLGSAWRFTVADNGIGVEPQHRQRIFGMFQRLHTDAEYPGTGIGLSLVKKIVERHDGQVEVGDTPGGGTTISFTISATLGRV